MLKKLLLVTALLLALTSGAVLAQDQENAVLTPASGVFAAWQPFQHGVMMWWRDTDQIWVMVHGGSANSGVITVYDDEWNEGDNEGGGDAPGGFFRPERGFGRIWRQLGAEEGALGWAFTPELGYDSAGRAAGANGWTIIDGPGNTVYGVFIPANSSVGVWQVIQIA